MTTESDFLEYHNKNPWVYAAMVKLAREAIASGRDKVGCRLLLETARWTRYVTTRGNDYKINNNYAPHYARLIMAREPDLAGRIPTRVLGKDRGQDPDWDLDP